MTEQRTTSPAAPGCWGWFGIVLLVGLVVMALISLAAVVDPFDWLPTASAVWAGCQDDPGIPGSQCALAHRFPGFWEHAIVNLMYDLAAGGAVIALVMSAVDYRTKRATRFDSAVDFSGWREVRDRLRLSTVAVAVLAAVPLIVAAIA